MASIELAEIEIAELPNILALARMNIGAQLANGVKDEGGRAIALLAAISGIEARLMQVVPVESVAKRKRANDKEAHA